MKIKRFFLFALFSLAAFGIMASEQLGVFVDVKRYLDDKQNTNYAIDYQVPYKNLMFKMRDKVFYAELHVNLSISTADSIVYTKDFTNNIGVTKKFDLSSEAKSFLDRISLTLAKPGYKLIIRFTDISSEKFYVWEYITEQLNNQDLISDLDLLNAVNPDSTLYTQKFKKNGNSYIPNVSGLVAKDSADSLYIFCEAYGIYTEFEKAVLTVTRDSTVYMIQSKAIQFHGKDSGFLFAFNPSGWESGKYTAKVELRKQQDVFVRALQFFITETAETTYGIFNDVDDELVFIRSTFSWKTPSEWDSMTKEARKRYISNFWLDLASDNGQSANYLVDLYKKRIDYCNARFSHFEKGWKSDMGRIYIRNGPPDEIDSDTTTDETKYVRKDYQIWKYTGQNHPVYVFVDVPMNGNYKLVYAENDEQESTNPNWKRYLGTDFDESRLEN